MQFDGKLDSSLFLVYSWFYRIRPSAVHEPFKEFEIDHFTNNWDEYPPSPNQFRWKPFSLPPKESAIDFIEVFLVNVFLAFKSEPVNT